MDYTKCILAAIDFIEENLLEDCLPHEVAARIGFSEYHFHRIFQGMLGESMASYIRKRRMAEAARLLTSSDISIYEIALTTRFETHESFTRAFKKVYGINPAKYRTIETTLNLRHKERMTIQMIEHLVSGITINPRFEIREPELAIGLARSFQVGDFDDIERLWDAFKKRQHEILHVQEGYAVGVCMAEHPGIKKGVNKSLIYLAGVPVRQVAKVPRGMISCTIPKAKYAVFTHKGSLDTLPSTVNYIWGTWIPKHIENYGEANSPDFELYDWRYNAKDRSGEFEIYVPVEPIH